MAENIVPVSLVGENVAGIGELFFEFLEVRGHHLSLSVIEDRRLRIDN
jgi:hypothetical protein